MDVSSLNLLRGFRLRPTDEEIIDFLCSKNSGNDGECPHIREVRFYKHEPWELPDFSILKDEEWFFFSPLDPKHRNGKRSNRRTEAGFWKVTGKDDTMKVGKLLRTRRILVFYQGPSKGRRTDWVTHEYRITLEDGTNPFQNTLVLYHLFDRSNKNSNRGRGQKFGKSGPGVSIPTKSKPRTKAKPPRASTFPVPEVQAEDIQTSTECVYPENSGGTISDSIATVQCTESGYSAYATANEVDLQLETTPRTPLTSFSNTAAVSSPTTAKSSPEEAESGQARASISPALGEEARNYLISCCPANTFEGTTTPNTVASTNYNHIGDNLYSIDNQVAEATADEVGDSDMSDVPPEPRDWSSLFAEFHPEMQEEVGWMSEPVINDLNCQQVGVPSEYGTNQSAADISFSHDDVFFLNDLNENQIGDDGSTRKNQAAGVAAREVVDSDMSDGSSLFPVVLLDMQEEIGRMSQPATDDLDCHRGGVPSEYGTNQPAADNSFLPDDVLFLNDLNENYIGDYANTGKNQVAGVAADEVLDSNMSDVVPESPGLSSFCASQFSPLSTEMQKDSAFSWSFEDLEYLLWWEPSQVGPNSTGITAFADSTSDNPNEVPHNDPSSQKNIAFDRETQENMESVKDNGSTVHRMLKKPNALLDPTSQDSMWSEEIYGETSSDFLHTLSNYVGISSIRSLF